MREGERSGETQGEEGVRWMKRGEEVCKRYMYEVCVSITVWVTNRQNPTQLSSNQVPEKGSGVILHNLAYIEQRIILLMNSLPTTPKTPRTPRTPGSARKHPCAFKFKIPGDE